MTVSKLVEGFARDELNHGERLQRFAARTTGDARHWAQVAQLNRLRPPFVTGDMTTAQARAQRVALYGDTLAVPAPGMAHAPVATDEAGIYGTDVALPGGRLQASGGDFAVVAGLPNLRQALEHRVRVEHGDLMFHPKYGSRLQAMIGLTPSREVATIAAAAFAKEAVAEDPRVVRVSSASGESDGDAIRVSVVADIVTGGRLPVSVRVAP